MQPARIAELLQPYIGRGRSEPAKAAEEPDVLSPALLGHISTYIDILLRWNARMNLTAIRDEEEIATRHFGESLFAANHLFSGSDREARGITLADLGSGAGFPGIPIKLWVPHVHVTLIESNWKKATFLREVVRALTLTDIDIQNVRAETLAGQAYDTITLRAVERFESILPTAARLIKPTGRLVLMIGSQQIAPARVVLPKLDWSVPASFPLSSNRVLTIARKSRG